MKLVTICLFFVISAFTALAGPAPVTILKTCTDGCGGRGPNTVAITFRNTGDKEITAVKFKVLFIDSVGDSHDPMQNYTVGFDMKVGSKKTGYWEDVLYGNYLYKMTAIPIKVMFKDGTTWEADQK